jgi:hypothetical protein
MSRIYLMSRIYFTWRQRPYATVCVCILIARDCVWLFCWILSTLTVCTLETDKFVLYIGIQIWRSAFSYTVSIIAIYTDNSVHICTYFSDSCIGIDVFGFDVCHRGVPITRYYLTIFSWRVQFVHIDFSWRLFRSACCMGSSVPE